MEEHGLDLQKLKSVTDQAHLSDNPLVLSFRQNKYALIMSKYSFELLLSFLQDNKFMLILRLMNQYITIQATSEKPGNYDSNQEGMGLTGPPSQSLAVFNQQHVTLEKREKDKSFYQDIERALTVQIHSDALDLLTKVKSVIATIPADQQPQEVPLPPKYLISNPEN